MLIRLIVSPIDFVNNRGGYSTPRLSFLGEVELKVKTIMASKHNSDSAKNSSKNRVVYSEFGQNTDSAALERGKPDLPPAQQNLTVQASRKGRKGKTVTVISGFQSSEETLQKLVKQLKTQCGSGGTLKDDTIEIQGEHTQKLVEILTKLGYKAKISGR